MRRSLTIFQLVVNHWHILSYPESGKGRKNLKRPNPFISDGVEEGSSSRLHSSEGNGYQVSRPPITGTRGRLHDHVVSRVSEAEAEAFLQDMSDSFRPRKMLKIEPMDVPLPPAPRSVQTVRFLLPISWIYEFLNMSQSWEYLARLRPYHLTYLLLRWQRIHRNHRPQARVRLWVKKHLRQKPSHYLPMPTICSPHFLRSLYQLQHQRLRRRWQWFRLLFVSEKNLIYNWHNLW